MTTGENEAVVHIVLQSDGSLDVYINSAYPLPEPKGLSRQVERVLAEYRTGRKKEWRRSN
jgi:hypothetical protein